MLKKIEKKEILTTWEAKNKYRDKYFRFVITEQVDGCDNDLGYVVYTYDNKREMRGIPREEFKNVYYGSLLGVAAEPPDFGGIGRIMSYDTD